MKKKWPVFAALFILFVIYLAPANLLNRLVPSNAPVQYAHIEGRLWQGQIKDLKVKQLDLGDARFDLSPLSLITANPGGHLILTGGDIEGRLDIKLADSNKIEWRDANLRAEALVTEPYIPIAGVRLSGNLIAESFSGSFENRRPLRLDGKTRWQNASIDFQGQQWTLGNIELQWQTDSDAKKIVAEVSSDVNKLGLRGTITLTENGVIEFIGSISQTAEKPIYDTLSMFADGKPAAGRLPLKFKQKVF